MHLISVRNIGGPTTPHDVQRLRRNNIETLRRFGQPVIWKHVFTQDDLDSGGYEFQIASGAIENIPVKRCVACWDSDYESVRGDCPVCFGVGLTSVEDDPSSFINDQGRLVDQETDNPAPLHGGYGPSVLTWTIQPDVPEDVFRISDRGVLTRVQTSTVLAPWTPDMADNDLLINVVLQNNDFSIQKVLDRHILKQVAPQTTRGYGKYSRGRDYKAGQQFQMTKLPLDNPLYQVALSKTWIDAATVAAIAEISALETGPFLDADRVRGRAIIGGSDTYN